jgi:hypothetical protein
MDIVSNVSHLNTSICAIYSKLWKGADPGIPILKQANAE